MKEKLVGQVISWEDFTSQSVKMTAKKINRLLQVVRLTASEEDFMT